MYLVIPQFSLLPFRCPFESTKIAINSNYLTSVYYQSRFFCLERRVQGFLYYRKHCEDKDTEPLKVF
jgi:hypothetical protein